MSVTLIAGFNKHDSFLRYRNNYGRTKFYDTGPWSLEPKKQRYDTQQNDTCQNDTQHNKMSS
jgi:hypothetical protein